MLGSGSLAGGNPVHAEFDSDGASLGISADMRLFLDGFCEC
jgi:hypothetical protein